MVTLKASRDIVCFSGLMLAFYMWWSHIRFKNPKSGIYLWRWWSIINLCLPQNLFSAIIRNPIDKSQMLFVKGTRAMLMSGFFYWRGQAHALGVNQFSCFIHVSKMYLVSHPKCDDVSLDGINLSSIIKSPKRKCLISNGETAISNLNSLCHCCAVCARRIAIGNMTR